MIRKISFSNFYSFKKQVTIDFTVNSRAPKNLSYLKTCDKLRLSKIYTIIGANASGKTNFIRSLNFIGWFAKYSYFQQQENQEIPYKPFLLDFRDTKNPISNFFIEIEEKKGIYQYEFSLTQNKVQSESLKQIYPKKKLIFSRYQYEKQAKYNLSGLNISDDLIKNNIKKNASLLSLVLTFPNNQINDIFSNFNAFTNVKETGYVDPGVQLENVLKKLEKQPEKKTAIISLIRDFDIDFNDIDIHQDSQGRYIHTSYGIHRIKNKQGTKTTNKRIPLIYESSGTRYLISIFNKIYEALSTGIPAIIDEIDNNLHPLIVPALTNLFINNETNPKNSQLIIGTHNVELLNNLDKSQIIISKKDSSGNSQIFKLSQMRGIKETDNLLKKYLSGSYGGIPKI